MCFQEYVLSTPFFFSTYVQDLTLKSQAAYGPKIAFRPHFSWYSFPIMLILTAFMSMVW
jgi:hypothetical protein